jgi:hypothetical protein
MKSSGSHNVLPTRPIILAPIEVDIDVTGRYKQVGGTNMDGVDGYLDRLLDAVEE